MFAISLTLLFALVYHVHSQSPTTSYVESTVPTGKPIPGDYNGALRPQVHYSPPIGFMVSRCGHLMLSRQAITILDPLQRNIGSFPKIMQRVVGALS